MEHKPYGPYEAYIKRPLDFCLSLGALIVLSPVMGVTAILVKRKLGSPIFFVQERPGLNGKIFKMYKFRTMLDPQTKDGRLLTDQERLECIENGIEILSDEERLPKLGRILRATSLDELPELINILKGDMSVVGPRPLATIYLPYYNEIEKHRHDVRPGLTGKAQVHGRNSASWRERFRYDLEYVNHITFIEDVKTVLDTVKVVLLKEDIGQGLEKPMAFNIERQLEWDKEKGTEK